MNRAMAGVPSVLDVRGPAAGEAAILWWALLATSVVVFTFVCVLIVVALRRARTATDPRRSPPLGERFIVVVGVFVTGAVLVAAFAFSVRQMHAIALDDPANELTVEVISHDFWWEARYPNGAIVANELVIPVDRPIRFKLTSADVIHSFWVPQLGPKRDLVPGRTNEIVLQADEQGRYRGQCAEFCGLQHANMIFWVEAVDAAEFDRWVAHQVEPAEETAQRGRRVFETGSCAGCHTIRGTLADGRLGPDLTHLASRETIGSGIIPLTRANLRDWVVDPQDIKPGVVMPPTEVGGDELEALLDYLLGLE